MKIAIIGPIPPYRGGIAHSNAILCANLQKNHKVTAVSFKRMFPTLLYPGKKQKDPDSAPPENLKIIPILDSLNPLSWYRTYKHLKTFDHVVFQWWSPFFAPAYSTIAYLLKKTTKAKLSVICQNVTSHEDRGIDTFLTKFFFKTIDYFIAYSSSDKQDVKRLLPQAKVDYIIEGTYDNQLGSPISKESAKKKANLKGNVILFFGFVRKYKGLEYLIDALPSVLKKIPVTLVIAGEFWEQKNELLQKIEKLGLSNNVKILDKYLSDKETITYFCATDAVVLPYISSTESGIIQLAYGLNTPVITTDVGGNKDLIDDGKTGLLVPPKNPKELAHKIIRFYEKKMEQSIKKNMKTQKKRFLWTKEKEDIFLGKF